MRYVSIIIMFFCLVPLSYAGDDASGPVKYSADFFDDYDRYKMNKKDKNWSSSLVQNLRYKGKVVHFVRTSIPLLVDGQKVLGQIYKAVEEKSTFYIINCDAMLITNAPWLYNPGVGGFSMHTPKSKDFIVSLNFQKGGVPFLSSIILKNGKVKWKGHKWRRFK